MVLPYTAFNFRVDLYLEEGAEPLGGGAFSECSGLEMNIEARTIKEGGNNNRQIHLVGRMNYAQLSLKRGMAPDFALWDWFEQTIAPGGQSLRASGLVVMLAPDGETETARFVLEGCLPVKIKAAALNAQSGAVAIEEMQILYEKMRRQPDSGESERGVS